MSEENVEIVRRLFEAVARNDNAAVLAAYDPNVECDFSESPLAGLVGSTVYRGHDGMRNMVRDRYEAWETMEDDCQELIDAGERVISDVISRGRGRSSGVDVELRHYGVWTIRDGKIVRVAWFYSREDALEAAGLRGAA
jgi:ketosteroid isomerase-like protein